MQALRTLRRSQSPGDYENRTLGTAQLGAALICSKYCVLGTANLEATAAILRLTPPTRVDEVVGFAAP